MLSSFQTSDSWVILSPIEASIKAKIESVGTPLRDWDVKINRGVLTGLNEAFIISTEKRNEILSNCRDEDERRRTAELIRPILRGRDIRRYGYEWANLWLINAHNGVPGKYKRIEIENYPAIKQHLDEYHDELFKRADQGDTPYNLRNCAYLDDFNKPKIVYPDIAQRLSFALSEKGEIINNTAYFFTCENDFYLRYLLIMLNSKLIDWYYRTISVQLGEKAVRMFSIYVEKLRIPNPSWCSCDLSVFSTLNQKTLDQSIYKAYGLSQDEEKYITNYSIIN